MKINGAKYYKKDTSSSFYLMNGQEIVQKNKSVPSKDKSAYKYFEDAMNFKNQLSNLGILDLKVSDAVDPGGSEIKDENGNVVYDFSSNEKIFEYENSGTSIEEPDSNFNRHRLAVIRYSIEKNLSIAIANYNKFGSTTANFQMPKLKENEWEKILNNVSIISFLQGLSIGGKVYNGYSIVTNNKTEEVISENSIYITDSNGQYHKPTDKNIESGTNLIKGYFNIDFEKKSRDIADQKVYYYSQTNLACYNCIVMSTSLNSDDGNIYKYMDYIHSKYPTSKLPELYYTALARERYCMYKTNRIV